jgi:superfamily II DNA/RNA helicase
MLFQPLGLSPELLRALVELDHTVPTPVQLQAIPAGLEGGAISLVSADEVKLLSAIETLLGKLLMRGCD